MRLSRRAVLLRGLLGTGYLGLRALSSGLPAAVLLNPRFDARADGPPVCADRGAAQFLLLSTSVDGDPVNANTPGTYDFPDIAHSADPKMKPTPLRLGNKTVTAAAPWATLPQRVLDRTVFFHHATLTNVHPHIQRVLRLQDSTAQKESLPALVSRYLAGCLGTVQSEPIAVGTGDVLTAEGKPLGNLRPTALRDALLASPTPLAKLPGIRDETLDRIYALIKNQGSPAAKAWLDQNAKSRSQARSIADQLLATLGQIKDDGPDSQVLAAIALIRLAVSPVVAVRLDFGGDNHFDHGLVIEAAGTVNGVGQLGVLMSKLAQVGLADRVSFAMVNVFGRTLSKRGMRGRDHWPSHATAVLIGKRFRAGVVGGLTPQSGDYAALPIDSQSGRGDPNGDIPLTDTLAALGKTLARGLGLPQDLVEQSISSGKIVKSAVV